MVLRIMTPYNLKSNNGRFGENYCFRTVQINVEIAGTSVKSVIRYETTGCHTQKNKAYEITQCHTQKNIAYKYIFANHILVSKNLLCFE